MSMRKTANKSATKGDAAKDLVAAPAPKKPTPKSVMKGDSTPAQKRTHKRAPSAAASDDEDEDNPKKTPTPQNPKF